MPKTVPLIRTGFSQGIKSAFDPATIPTNALWRARDVVCDVSGILRLRHDVDLFGDSLGAGKIQGADEAFGGLLVAWNRGLYTLNASGDSSLVAENLIGSDAAAPAEIVRWSRSGAEAAYLFAGSGIVQAQKDTATNIISASLVTPYTPATGEKSNLIRKADGTQDTSSGPARCRYAILKASLSQRLVVTGDPKSPNAIYMSAPLDATYFPSDQILQLPDDGAVITGLMNWYNALIIFRDRDIWAFFGSSVADTSAALILQSSSVGCVNGKSIASVPGIGLVFLSTDNIYGLKGVTAVENQLDPVPLADDIRPQLTRAQTSGVKEVNAVYHDGEYRICFPNCIDEDRVFRLSLKTAAGWYIDSGPITGDFVIWGDDLYATDRITGQAYRFQKEYTEGQDTRFFAQFRRENLQPGPARVKKVFIYTLMQGSVRPQELNFFGPGYNEKLFGELDTESVNVISGTEQNLKITAIVDGHKVTVDRLAVRVARVETNELSISEPVRIFEARFTPSLKGHFVQIQIESINPGEDVSVLGYGIEYSNRERIHGIKTGVTV